MRKIIFRAKRKDNVWVYGSHVVDANGNHFILSPLCGGSGKEIWKKAFQYNEVIPETIGQFTGLTDKNGKEIYEGDVVLCKEFENMGISIYSSMESEVFSLKEFKGECKETYTSQVFYEEANFYVNQDNSCEVPLCCFFGNMKNSNPIFEIEIIGNIHDNPSLLTNKE